MKDKQHFVYVFDLDNTLVKTNTANNKSYQEAIGKYVSFDVEISASRRFTRDDLFNVFPKIDDAIIEKIVSLKEQLFEKYLSETKLNENLFRILVLLNNREDVLLLTDSRTRRAKQILAYYSLSPFFSGMYYHENFLDCNKYQFLEKIGIDKTQVVLFENSQREKYNAIKNGIVASQIIKVKF